MSTVAPPLLTQLAKDWEKTDLTSAVCSGVIGDAAHAARGGYHIGRKWNPSDNYSVVRPDDKAGNGPDDAAAAIDMTMSTQDMITCTKRLMALYTNSADPRRKYLNAFNGWLGSGGAQRFDVYARRVGSATSDHKWHCHLEVRRKYVGSATAMAAILSALKGQSVAAYLAGIGHPAATVTGKTTTGSTPAATKPAGTKPAATKLTGTAPAFPGTLQRNDQQSRPDAGVKAFQQQLLKRGWASLGSADGLFGPKLEAVVKRWQTLCGLTADGVIGAKTWPTPWTRPLGS